MNSKSKSEEFKIWTIRDKNFAENVSQELKKELNLPFKSVINCGGSYKLI